MTVMQGFGRADNLTRQVVISSDLKAARKAEQKLLREISARGYDEQTVFAIKLAVEEGLNNAVRHGNGYDSNKRVVFEFDVNAERVEVVITDEGLGFNPDSIPDPTVDENLEKPSGRGIMLMRAYMDKVEYNSKGNRIFMIKHNR